MAVDKVVRMIMIRVREDAMRKKGFLVILILGIFLYRLNYVIIRWYGIVVEVIGLSAGLGDDATANS